MTLADLSPFASHLWQSSVCAAVAGLLSLVLKKNRAEIRYWIWLAASVKFLVPFSLLVAAGTHLVGSAAPARNVSALPAMIDQISRPFAVAVPAPLILGAAPPVYPAALFFAVWFVGFAVSSACWLRWWWRIRQIRRAAVPIDLRLPIPVRSSAMQLEPGVFGIFRPVLLLPAGIGERLSPHQLEAVLAHELCHVRRRDNLTGAIHMLVEAIFWSHPLVWWIGWRLLDEREQACDETVLQLGKEPEVYAESILAACKYYLESPLRCVAGVTGADLKKRIESIMRNRGASNLDLSRKLLLTVVSALVLAAPLVVGLAHAQQPQFEAASVKPSQLGFPDQMRPTPDGGFNARYVSLKQLIQTAYNLQDFQLSGGPSWLDDDRYDIVAKGNGNPAFEQIRARLRSLLAERFHLEVHRETKELPVYVLTVAKNGPKLTKAENDGKPLFGMVMSGPGRIQGHGMTVQQLAGTLSSQFHRIVLDKTDIPGAFDIAFLYTPEGYKKPSPEGRPNPNEPQPDPDGPSVFTAIQEQLGLRLEGGKGPVEVLVIDRAEKATAN